MKIKPINNTDEFFRKLSEKGKVINLNKPEHFAAIDEMNKAMQKVHRDFIQKNAASELSARNTYVF